MNLPGLRERHPQNEDKLEGIVEGKPVDSIHSALKDGQKGIDNPVLTAVNIERLAWHSQSSQLTVNH